MRDRITPVPMSRVKLDSSIPRPSTDAEMKEWGQYFANVALEISRRLQRPPTWVAVSSILGVIGFAISMVLLAWRICQATGGPCK